MRPSACLQRCDGAVYLALHGCGILSFLRQLPVEFAAVEIAAVGALIGIVVIASFRR